MADPLLTDPTAPSFDDPLGMMAACHRRIERQLATLSRLQRHLPEHGCDADARAAARAILRYFDAAAPNHHADEEDSVFPRLEAALAVRPVTLMAELEDEHVTLGARWTKLRPLLAAIAAGQRANLPPKLVAELTTAYASHIAREESQLMPLAAQMFDAATIAQIGKEMAQRRNIAVA